MRCFYKWIVVSLVVAAGCDHDQFELRLTPKDGKLQRDLTTYHVKDGLGKDVTTLPAEELERIAKEFGQPLPGVDGPKRTFSGVFARRMPQDVGGFGTYVEWPSEFGATRVYLERFRGDDDLVAAFDRHRTALERLSDLLVGWVDVAWADQPEQAAMRRFVHRDLRRDLINLAFYLKASKFSGAVDESPESGTELDLNRPEFEGGARILQYLIERQYLNVDQAPQLARTAVEASRGDGSQEQEFMHHIVAIVRRKIGVPADQPLPPSLAFLVDADRLKQSLNEVFCRCDEHQAKLEQWRATPIADRATGPPEPVEVIGELLAEGFASVAESLLGRPHQLSVTMGAAVKPVSTNGRWDADKKTITWSKEIPDSDQQLSTKTKTKTDTKTKDKTMTVLPTLLYAVWAEPAAAEQVRRLGSVVLRDGMLGQFCIWRNGLKPDEVRQWTPFVESLRPGDGLLEQFEKFRFDGEPEEVQESHLSAVMRKILRDSLQPKEAPK